MCLWLKSKRSCIQTAKRDLIVYKYIQASSHSELLYSNEMNDGVEFHGVISDIECCGKISIDDTGRVFFCTDDYRLDGLGCINRHGFTYSWIHDKNVSEIYINGSPNQIITVKDYATPFQRAIVEIGETYHSALIKTGDRVEEGLHSYQKLGVVERFIDATTIGVKCIIPKGSKYYVGTYGKDVSYASDKLIYVELIEP